MNKTDRELKIVWIRLKDHQKTVETREGKRDAAVSKFFFDLRRNEIECQLI